MSSKSPNCNSPSEKEPLPASVIVERMREAEARARLCAAFWRLLNQHHFTTGGAARLLGLWPSTVSGKNSLPGRYQAGGVAALMLGCKAPRASRIARLTEHLKAGGDLVFDGDVLAQGLEAWE